MSLLQRTFSKLYRQDLPCKAEDIFSTQREFLQSLLDQYSWAPLYQNLGIKQEDVDSYSASQLKQFLSQYKIISYKEDIIPLLELWKWITAEEADLHIKTSGTSDAQQWGKLIPTQRDSLEADRQAIKRTLSCYLDENPSSKVFLPYSFALTAPFDKVRNEWYISGALRETNKIAGLVMFPSQDILRISDNQEKKEQIVAELLEKVPSLRSIHGVPAWPLGILDDIIEQDSEKAKKILHALEYVSIGGGAPHDFKQQYEKRLRKIWLTHDLYGSNNHNASEWFFGAQVRKFWDLEFQAMAPFYQSNFFLFVPEEKYIQWKSEEIDSRELILTSMLLHEVESEKIYFLLFANDRIPWLYDIKDKVKFLTQEWANPLEYEVVGRLSMSSNIINEHLESDIIQQVLSNLIDEWFELDRDAFVAGMELNQGKTAATFHILIEGAPLGESKLQHLKKRFDSLLWDYNGHWKSFRENNTRITNCCLVIKPQGYIRETMMKIWLGHEQSKIPFLSDGNYEVIVKPLLSYTW